MIQHTLQQSRGAFRHVFEQDLAAAKQQEAIQRRFVFIFEDCGAGFAQATGAKVENFDGVSGRILQQEPVAVLEIYQHHPCQYVRQAARGGRGLPAASLGQSGLICFGDRRVVQAIQRHGGAGALLVLRCNSAGECRRSLRGRSRVARQARARYIRALRGSDGIGLIIEAWPEDRVAGARIRQGRRDAGRSCRGRLSERRR